MTPNNPHKILIVDDDNNICDLLARWLRQEGYICQTAYSAGEALELMARDVFSLLVTDINMPEITGLELQKIARREQEDLAVIMVTAVDDRNIALDALKNGAYGYVIKPFERIDVLINVDKALRLLELEIKNKNHLKKLEQLVAERTGELEKAYQELQSSHDQILQQEKMACLGQLAAGVAHEINNPNNFIMLNAPLLLDIWKSTEPILEQYYREEGEFDLGGLPFSEMRENIPQLFSGILEGSKRIKNIVENLKDYARPGTSDMHQKVEINDVINAAVTLLANVIKKSTDNFSIELTPGLPLIKGNFQRLEQVTINLIQNACESLQEKKDRIEILSYHDREKDKIVIKIRDEGRGIPADKLPSITDPFYTTRRAAGGTGLGLSISSGIVKEHMGQMSFRSTPGQGTIATLILPVHHETAGAEKTT